MPGQRSIAEAAPRVFLVLLDGTAGGATAESLSRLAPAGAIRTLIPPLTGAAFLEDATRAGAVVDGWWEGARAGPDRPVVLVTHEESLPRMLPGLDADFVVAVPDAEIEALYAADLPNVRAVVADDPSLFAQFALREHFSLACAPARPLDPLDLLAEVGALTGPARPPRLSLRRVARLKAARPAAPEG